MDWSLFARQTDVEQWKNGFGISGPGARGAQETNGAFRIWDWAYGGQPPNNTANVLEPPLRAGLFDNESSVTVFDQVPREDEPPDYPPPH